ncbi:hypothetical protein K1719_025493 [Acacia pycnantha]|nr:hypothetical protein K1719_025493 [Acacia pycnantha]
MILLLSVPLIRLSLLASNADEMSSIPGNAHPGETVNGSYLEENACPDSLFGQNLGYSADGHNSFSHTQGVEDYNRLVGRYYELEEQRREDFRAA